LYIEGMKTARKKLSALTTAALPIANELAFKAGAILSALEALIS